MIVSSQSKAVAKSNIIRRGVLRCGKYSPQKHPHSRHPARSNNERETMNETLQSRILRIAEVLRFFSMYELSNMLIRVSVHLQIAGVTQDDDLVTEIKR